MNEYRNELGSTHLALEYYVVLRIALHYTQCKALRHSPPDGLIFGINANAFHFAHVNNNTTINRR